MGAREVNGQEQPVGEAKLANGVLLSSFGGYQPRTFALKLGAAKVTVAPITSRSVDLKYDLASASNDDTKTVGGGMDGKGDAFPAEMLPTQLSFRGVDFNLAPGATGTPKPLYLKIKCSMTEQRCKVVNAGLPLGEPVWLEKTWGARSKRH
jgi:alpha-mannosidase